MNSRAVAARILLRVTYQGDSLTDALQQNKALQALSSRDQSWVRHTCFGCVRWHGRISAILGKLLSKPLKKADKDIECLLRTGLYQLIYQRTPDHAAVHETVAAAGKLKKKWAGGLLNGVLRSFLRDQDKILTDIESVETARYSFPPWLTSRIKQAWPQQWEAILQASNQQAPLSLRVNQRQISREAYQQKLSQYGIVSTSAAEAASALTLEQALPVDELPDFGQGAISVQDTAAQLAAPLLQCQAGQRVLDACAAPGGKTCHLLEIYPDVELWALDNSLKRTQQIHENLERLKLSARVMVADATETTQWWDGCCFDRILLDAPCSASGVIRRHPDIKLLRKDADIAQLQQQQFSLLQALWPVLQPGGLLLYVTCSLLPEENNLQVEHFLRQTPNAKHHPINAAWGHEMAVGRQIHPGEDGMDGFYYALLEKIRPENDNDN